jgi:hypothetical protein
VSVVLSDPRDTPPIVRETRFDERYEGDFNNDFQTLIAPARLAVVEARGSKAPFPAAVTDDFTRRVHVEIDAPATPAFSVAFDVTMNAADLRHRATQFCDN